MRLKLMLCGVTTIVPALLLTGCGVDQTSMVTPNVQSAGVEGRVMGGQQPVVGATIAVYAMGTSGYGSTGTILSSAITDSSGNFTLPSYTCPQSNTPVYLLGIGGNAGSGINPSAVLGSSLGPCAVAQKSFVIMNEITTTSLAFALSHFFSTTLGGSDGANDWFGGPSTVSGGATSYSSGLMMGNGVTSQMLVNNSIGAPNQTTGGGGVVEWEKINTIANILAACINTSGATSTTETKTPCGKLFHYTQNGATVRPSDTLQAAVQMALFPNTDVTDLYNLIPTTPAFPNYMTGAPNDWSIGVSYTTSALGLAVNTGTLSTLDIDSSGNIWFPSNASGHVGVAFFNPENQTFNGPYNTTTLTFPQQVAIDADSYVWVNDSGAAAVAGYLTTGPATTEMVSLPNTISNSLTVGGDNRINVGITAGAKFEMANVSTDRTGYSVLSGVSFIYPVQSIAGDISDGDAVTVTDPTTTTMRNYYVTSGGTLTDVVNANQDSGQVIYTGNDDISVRSWTGSGTGANDGLCIYSTATCYNLKGGLEVGTQGMAIDGGKQLWIAMSRNAGVIQVPVNSPSNANGAVYLNSTGAANIPVNELLHTGGQGAGATGTAVTPYGVGVDWSGNVWLTNAGCTVTNCAPGTFTLTEIIGAAYPTITPVSAQITSGNLVGTEPTQ
jgi:hypothetical protein